MKDIAISFPRTPDMSNELERAITELRAGHIEAEAFLRLLGRSKLVVPLVESDSDSAGLWVFSWQGRPHAAVFTDTRHVASLGDVERSAEITGTDLAASWPEDVSLSLNPGVEGLDLVMPPQDFRRVAHQLPQGGAKVRVGAPAEPPPAALMDAARRLGGAVAGVDDVYVFVLDDSLNRPRIAVGLELGPAANPSAVVEEAAEWLAAQPGCPRTDVMVLGANLLRSVREHVSAV
ncbi:SseB family protein [Rhodococcus oryzae]|uniref:SseB family protein n=1 Tax=Rhodococcus oryzae TaxID=2571143 RepID=A0ABY2RMH1_9NOCA|nr:SseB family protein [Rhodococcus oryzae]TJZ79484.1 SseB family protein [Rhodococcus oryzae]